jgi:hypothetical protein
MCVWGVEGVMKWRPVGEEVEAGEEQVMLRNELEQGGDVGRLHSAGWEATQPWCNV